MGPGPALHVVAGLQAEAADLGDGEVDVLGAGVVVVHAEEPVPVGQHLQHALRGGAVLRFQHLGHGGVGGAVLLVIVGLLLLPVGGGIGGGGGAVGPLVLDVLVRIAALAVGEAAVVAVDALLIAVGLGAFVPAMVLLPGLLLPLRLGGFLGGLLGLLRGRGLGLLRGLLPLPIVLPLGGRFGRLLGRLLLRRLRLLGRRGGGLLGCRGLGGTAPLLGGRGLALAGKHLDQLVFPIFAYVFHAQSLRHGAKLRKAFFLQFIRSHLLPPKKYGFVCCVG